MHIYIKTFGCQMNIYDSQKIVKIMKHAFDMDETEDPNQADLILLNTCSVRAKAEEKVFSDLGRLKKIKDKRPEVVLGVCGCVASQERDTIFTRAPYVDLVFGPQAIHRLPQMYRDIKDFEKRIIDTKFYQNEKFHCQEADIVDSPSAFVTIMEGCNNFCSYCEVPFTRGREISRPIDEVLAECEKLCANGVVEINFLGQNVNSYCGLTQQGHKTNLATLLLEAAKIDSLKRIRFTTSHPKDFTNELIQAFAQTPKIVNLLHLPVQSGSDRILHLMRRNYTTEEYQTKIALLREIRPNISISSDFIVGFPGETEEDFNQTLELVEAINFDTSYSFIYSRRPNTQALKLEDNIPLSVKKQRLYKLQELLNKQNQAISDAMLGTEEKVLVLGIAKKSEQLTGRTENNRIVNFIGNPNLIGTIIPLKITKVLTNCLLGEKL